MDAFLLAAAFATAVLSATMGMAGGLLLMGVYAAILPIPEAMVLHGFTQLVANGSRAAIQRAHIAWRPIGHYAAGAALAFVLFRAVSIVPNAAMVYLGVGALPFLTRAFHLRLDVTRRSHAVTAGVVVSGVQLLFGVAGPLLDVFFLGAPLDRHGVIATKALSQTMAHSLKIAAFLPLVDAVPLTTVAWTMIGAAAGTWAGSRILDRIPETVFRSATGALVLLVGGGYLARGVGMVWAM